MLRGAAPWGTPVRGDERRGVARMGKDALPGDRARGDGDARGRGSAVMQPDDHGRTTRTAEVDGRPVRIHDGMVRVEAIAELATRLLAAPFVCDEVARPDTYMARHWQLNLPADTARQLAVFAPTLERLREFPGAAGFRLRRAYCNFATFGDMLFTHTDVPDGKQGVTALWYIAPRWDIEWGGETILYDRGRDALVCVSPRPGRLLMFDGSILHAGRPPNRVCYAPRYTLAFKFEP